VYNGESVALGGAIHGVTGDHHKVGAEDEASAQILKQRTLTNLYNERPAWLDNVHRNLDEAVADAYGWPSDMPDDEILMKLLALNLERAKERPRRWAEGHARQPRRGRPSSDHGRDDP
jgi:hypothetical protein